MKKKYLFVIIIILFLQQIFSENFSLCGKYYPDLYSTIDVLVIEDNTVKYHFETTDKDVSVKYTKYYDSGLLFFKLSESFPKEISEYYYYYKDVETNDKMLVLAGLVKNEDNNTKGNVLLFATTKGFDKDSYPFIWPMNSSEITPKYNDCTSYLQEKTKVYSVENLSNCMFDTPWVEGVEGNGIGEGFTMIDRLNRCHPYLLIMNGYISYEKPYLYKQNNRIKKLKVTGLKSGKSKILDVLDTPHPQTVDISFITEPEDIRVEIADIYKGTKYDDTCLHYCITSNHEVIPYENSIGE